MPRCARLTYEGAFYHIFNRGVAKAEIFREAPDYRHFLLILVRIHEKKHFDHTIFAYVLLPNHFHLLIQSKKIPIAKVMTSLSTSYSMYFNRKYKRVGPLFQNRYKSKLCDKDDYFLVASRYIHLNPVSAGLVERLEDYPWSSYNEIFGHSDYQILDRVEVRRLIGETDKEKMEYQKYLGHSDEMIALDMQCAFEKDVQGEAGFATRAQRKYLRRIGRK